MDALANSLRGARALVEDKPQSEGTENNLSHLVITEEERRDDLSEIKLLRFEL